MPKFKVSVVIKRPKEQVYNVVKDVESFPNFMRDIKSLRIIKRTDNGIVAAWETDIDGAPVNWKEELYFDDANLQVKFNMLEGNYKEYQGRWFIENHHNNTKLSIEADIDWGIPILEKYVGKVLEEKARRGLLGMIQAIKMKLEKTNV